MKQQFYKYSVLKYSHSALLDEKINLGVLVYVSSPKALHFYYPNNLSRIKSIYHDVSDKVIKHYLKRIDEFVAKLNLDNDLFYSLELEKSLSSFINKYLLPKDESCLQFSPSIINYLEDELPADVIFKMLVERFIVDSDNYSKAFTPKEPLLSKKFYGYLKDLDFNLINASTTKFYKDYTVVNETGSEYKFDYAWQNGTLNLVKPLSFDLNEPKKIADKAYRNLGLFWDLEDEAEEFKLRYDLLIAKPEKKELFKEFDHALKLLSNLKHSSIVLEDDLELYSKRAIAALLK